MKLKNKNKSRKITRHVERKLFGIEKTSSHVSYKDSDIIECQEFKDLSSGILGIQQQFSRIVIFELGSFYNYVSFEFSTQQGGDLLITKKFTVNSLQ